MEFKSFRDIITKNMIPVSITIMFVLILSTILNYVFVPSPRNKYESVLSIDMSSVFMSDGKVFTISQIGELLESLQSIDDTVILSVSENAANILSFIAVSDDAAKLEKVLIRFSDIVDNLVINKVLEIPETIYEELATDTNIFDEEGNVIPEKLNEYFVCRYEEIFDTKLTEELNINLVQSIAVKETELVSAAKIALNDNNSKIDDLQLTLDALNAFTKDGNYYKFNDKDNILTNLSLTCEFEMYKAKMKNIMLEKSLEKLEEKNKKTMIYTDLYKVILDKSIFKENVKYRNSGIKSKGLPDSRPRAIFISAWLAFVLSCCFVIMKECVITRNAR